MPGTVYNIPPIPPDPEHTIYVDAGNLRIGVEHRILDDAELSANYEGAEMDEIQAAVDGQKVEDNGVSLHVLGRDDGHEYLRFDMFEREPHYHYINRSGESQRIIDYDRVAMGEMLPWALHQLRTRLHEMLDHAGGHSLIDKLEPNMIDVALREVETLAIAAAADLALATSHGAPRDTR
ncbi:MAG: hypothetical protein ACI8W3_003257 [Myxococcota bacterium]|jgi:hypothetical protein